MSLTTPNSYMPTTMSGAPIGGNKTDPLMLILVMLTSLFVFATGIIAVSYYSDTTKDVKGRIAKINFSSFVAYVLGLTPILILFVNYLIQFLPAVLFSRIFFIIFTIICLFAWILCAVVIADMSNDSSASKTKKQYLSIILMITLVFSLLFGSAAARGSLFGHQGNFMMPMMPMYAAAPMMQPMQQPMYAAAPMQPMMVQQPMQPMYRFGRRKGRRN